MFRYVLASVAIVLHASAVFAHDMWIEPATLPYSRPGWNPMSRPAAARSGVPGAAGRGRVNCPVCVVKALEFKPD